MSTPKKPPLEDAQERFAFALHHTTRCWRTALDRRLRRHGFTQSTWMLLTSLAQAANITQRDLAERLGIEGPTLVVLLDRLEREGLVERRSSDTDRRAKTVHLLGKGRDKLEIIQKVATELRGVLLQDVGIEDLERHVEFLTALRGKAEAL